MACQDGGSSYAWLCWIFRQMAATLRGVLDPLLVFEEVMIFSRDAATGLRSCVSLSRSIELPETAVQDWKWAERTCHLSHERVHWAYAEESVGILDVSAVYVTTYVHTCRVFSNARRSAATLRVRMNRGECAQHEADEEDSD